MLDLLASAGLWVTQLLLTVLPDSPITNWIGGLSSQFDAIHTGLAVMNVFVDINGMVILLGLWLMAMIAVYTAYWSTLKVPKLLQALTGSSGLLNNLWALFGRQG